jgi:hypothetical protein
MRVIAAVAGLGLVCGSFAATHAGATQEGASPPPQSPTVPGVVERAALAKVDFLVGDWEGEGWSVSRSGERRRFWVKEFYHYRGDGDLLDMEGRFGEILPDGTRGLQNEVGLGFLYFDRNAGEYRMWHYSSDGEAFTVTMEVDVEARQMQYTKDLGAGQFGRFRLVVGADGAWVSRFDILLPDQSWLQVMEFRMERITP